MVNGPLPPPPLPAQRPPGGGPGPNSHPQNGLPPPPPNVRPPGPPPGHFQLPMRNSTRVSDVTTRVPLGEAECKKRLTTYESHTIRKIASQDPKKEKTSWARSEITRESLAQEEILKQLRKLNENRRSVSDKKQTLQPFQQKQVNSLLDELNSAETDINFEWSLAQLHSKIKALRNGQRETDIITCYVKRAPRREVNPIGIYDALERLKADRMAAMTRQPPQPQQPPKPQQQPQPHPPPPPQQPQQFKPGGQEKGGNGGPQGIIKLNPDQMDRGRKEHPTRLPRPRKRSNRRHHHSDDTSSRSSMSDSESDSDYSYSSRNTSNSSTSDRQHRRQGHHIRPNSMRRRSHNRLREHRRRYYNEDDVHSSDPRLQDSFGAGPLPVYVPEVPRAINNIPVPSVQPIDPMIVAAYQAGKIDADAERLGLDRLSRLRPAPERPVVSYGRLEPRYGPDPRYPARLPDPRYIDELDDLRYREGELRRCEAEDCIDRTSEPRMEYISRRVGEPRVIYPRHNPFVPIREAPIRRYASSHRSY